MASLAEANTSFAMELFKRLEEEYTGNIFLSPISISSSLSMLCLGAKGNTAAQIEKVLHLDKITVSRTSTNLPAPCDKPGGPHNQFKELLSAINQPTKSYALSTANRLYGSNVFEFVQRYIECIKELYHADLESVDFVNAVEEVRKKINAWVESQTNGKIKDLFPVGSFDRNTALVLVNAIYFKGKWMRQFDPKETHEADFWTSKGHSKKVQMMVQKNTFNYAKITSPTMEVLELPYGEEDLSMFILLPDKNGATKEIMRQLTYEKFQEWTSSTSMQNTAIRISMPKFKLGEEYLLIPTLSSMGIKDLFLRGKADLSGISEHHDLFVSQVRHKAYIEVNEEGTEAAAATGGVVDTTSAQITPHVIVDRPFSFLIRHNDTKSILFAGRFSSP